MNNSTEQPDKNGAGTAFDFENCKGQCGYTVWCRECMKAREAELKAREIAEAQKEAGTDGEG